MKSSTILMAILALVYTSMLTSCEKVKGKGDTVNETRSTGPYTSIDLAMSATVHFTPDSTYSLKLSGQQNILDEIVTQVEGKRLVIKVRDGVTLKNFEPVTVYITAPDVAGLNISGSGNIFIDGSWTESDLSMNISGSGNINADSIGSGQLSANISGSGNISTTRGQVAREDLKISGSGNIDLRHVQAEKVYATISGSGSIYTYATSLLDVTISGSGDVWYYGTPSIETHISGSGNLRKL